MKCECRCGREVEVVRENEQPGQPYRLCRPCAGRLESFSLRPREWFSLASLHSPWKFHLHDDFYTTTGRACQNDVPVVREPGVMRAPTLRESARDSGRLFDYTFTRYFLVPEVTAAFRRLDPQEVLAALETCLSMRTPNSVNVCMACAVAAEVLGPRAEEFARRVVAECTEATFPGAAEAAAHCLPRGEGLAWALGFLGGLDAQRREALKGSLAAFGDVRVLDWIEAHVREIEVSERWQRLAASSSFSWPRAEAWIGSGRPLSLVALGALGMALGNADLSRLDLPSDREVLAVLDAYLERDFAPNPQNLVADIRASLAARA